MGSLTLGRATVATFDLKSLDLDGDLIRVGGQFKAALADALVWRDQLIGLGPHNTDEPVVPFSLSDDTRLSGFVVPVRVQVPSSVKSLDPGEPTFWDVNLELIKVPGWKAPLFEVVCKGALRSNSHAIADGEPWVGVSTTHDAIAVDGETIVTAGGTFPTSDSPSEGVRRVTGDGTPDLFYDAALTYAASAGTFYDNAARLQVTPDGGTTWIEVVGRQLSDMAGAAQAWRLSNAHVRVTASTEVTGLLHLLLEVWDSGAWATVIDAELTDATAFARFPYALTVLQNRPEAVAVRWHSSSNAPGGSKVEDIDVVIRRGASWVEVRRQVHADHADRLIIRDEAAAGSTAITAGLHRTSNDGAGNRWVLLSPEAQNNVTASGQLRSNATDATEQTAMIGVEVGGSSAVAGDTAAYLTTLYFAAMRHRQRIVTR